MRSAATWRSRAGSPGVLKSAHLAEAYNMKHELHHGGNSLGNLASDRPGLGADIDFELIARMTVEILRWARTARPDARYFDRRNTGSLRCLCAAIYIERAFSPPCAPEARAPRRN